MVTRIHPLGQTAFLRSSVQRPLPITKTKAIVSSFYIKRLYDVSSSVRFASSIRPSLTTRLRWYSCESKFPKSAEKSSPQTRTCKPHSPPPSSLQFWLSTSTWERAAVNTFRCLVGCTSGDFSAMWFLQMYYPELGVGWIMAMASKYTT